MKYIRRVLLLVMLFLTTMSYAQNDTRLIKFGIGTGIGAINTNSPTYATIDMDIICCNVLIGVKNVCNNDSHDITSGYAGFLVPILKNGNDGNIFIGPIVETISDDNHKITNETENTTKLGATIMVRYKYMYLMGKATNSTMSFTVGVVL